VIVPARNEHDTLYKTLNGLKKQSIPATEIIVINDGSTDDTREIAESFDVKIVNFPYSHESWVGKPQLAKVFNLGFAQLSKDLDYFGVVGADHVLPPTYFENLINHMEKDEDLVLASGKIQTEWSVTPRGSGRLIKKCFWEKLDYKYPERFGFESYPIFKASQWDYKTEHVNTILSTVQRKTSNQYNHKTYFNYGKAMKALGYKKSYAFGRTLVMTKRHGVLAGVNMAYGYLTNHVENYDPELREYVNNNYSVTKDKIIARLKNV